MQRYERDDCYATEARDDVFDQNMRQTGTRLLMKFIVPWYMHSSEVDKIKHPKNNSRHYIECYEQKPGSECGFLINAYQAILQCKLKVGKSKTFQLNARHIWPENSDFVFISYCASSNYVNLNLLFDWHKFQSKLKSSDTLNSTQMTET